jgi:hypothetical protein
MTFSRGSKPTTTQLLEAASIMNQCLDADPQAPPRSWSEVPQLYLVDSTGEAHLPSWCGNYVFRVWVGRESRT